MTFDRMALISTPWPLFNHPSIQLGTLKAYLKTQHPRLKVDAFHFFLQAAEAIGYGLYQAISESIWPAESFFGAMLFPERFERIERLYHRQAAGRRPLNGTDFGKIVSTLQDLSEGFIDSTEWGRYGLLGFSICLCQLTSSLYFIRRIKKKHPAVPVVVGGSGLGGNPGSEFFNAFPEVDFVVLGEGERPLSELIHHLQNGASRGAPLAVPGGAAGESSPKEPFLPSRQLEDLHDLRPPDYDDYFELLQGFDSKSTFFPTLPAEMSRGCWWRKRGMEEQNSGCAFCSLNLQWEGYRWKEPSQIAAEIDLLTGRYKLLSLAFTDNVLPVQGKKEVFEGLLKLEKDLQMFAEVRSSTSRLELKLMNDSGLHELQIGIEALSTRLLRKMNKGSSAIQNLQIMKDCEELGLINRANLLLEFPGSDEDDVNETLHNLDFALPFRPLKGVKFWLGLGSPIAMDPKSFGIKAVFNHPNYAVLFPPEIVKSTRFMIQGHRGGIGRQKKLWKPVVEKLKHWRKAHEEFSRSGSHGPSLSFRDGRSFLIIHQRRFGYPEVTHRLLGSSREIYLFCRKHRSVKRILARFPKLREHLVLPFLEMMVEKRLMFEEAGRYLSLAVSMRD